MIYGPRRSAISRWRAQLFKLDGTSLGSLPEDYNFEGGNPVQVDGDTWAVPSTHGAEALVFEVKSGRILRSIANIDDAIHAAPGAATTFAQAGVWPASPLAKTAGGKLVVVNAHAGVAVLDPSTGKIDKAWPLPACAP